MALSNGALNPWRVTLLSLSYCLAGTVLAHITSLYRTSIPTWSLLFWPCVGLPLGFAFKVLCTYLLHKYEAASMGTLPMPVIRGERFGNFDLMLRLLEYFKTGYPGTKHHMGMTDAVVAYGNCHNFRVMFDDLLFTCEPNHTKAILATDFDNFVKGDRFRATVSNVLGTGVFNSDGEMWKSHRSMARPFFSHARINHFNIFDRHTEDVINQDAISRFTLDSDPATEFLFGSCVHSLSAGLPYLHNVAPVEAPTDAIEKRKMPVMCGEKHTDEHSDEDTLLDHLVQLTTDAVILKDEILDIMIAGRDTTAATFVIYFLSTHPQVLARWREKVMTKIGPTNRPTYESIHEMKYLRAVINASSESIKATALPSSGCWKSLIIVSYSVFIMHRRKDLWGPDAEEFDPDRFLDHRLHKYLTPQPFIFLPFDACPRICLPPTAWAEAEGRKAREKVFPKVHLTMYAHGGLWVRMTEADDEIV
ncbi:cytochrome P450 [Gyrodon lividus]|nr:cytochrome P450 [Gyrodon lividus]